MSLKILSDANGQSKCSGMVRFSSRPCAENAINALNGRPMAGQDDKPLIVKYARPPAPRPVTFNPIMYGHHYPSQNISQPPPMLQPPPGSSSYPFRAPYPPSMHVMPPQYQQPVPPYRFNQIGEPSSGAPSPPVYSSACVYVSNLAADSTILQLFELFAPFGAITHVNVLPANMKNGHSSAIGFVNFVKMNEAFNAINALNRSAICAAPGKGLSVSFKLPITHNRS
ncbi:ELAV-like protein 2 [Octopus sinensis]|uniref:ELAV-like protein 2 n=1 Tax=Octopus sinensis TaxID=2607531 RepID=A0A6P7U355_9MOLL|nr:ELAV-like protein 2 [Octopus sinensis]